MNYRKIYRLFKFIVNIKWGGTVNHVTRCQVTNRGSETRVETLLIKRFFAAAPKSAPLLSRK